MKMKRRSGFTLVEILVVVVIIGMMAALVAPKVVGRGEEAKRTAAQVQISNLEQTLDLYNLDNGIYPTTEQGLNALIEKPTLSPEPRRWREKGYLKRIPLDPWGGEYIYRQPGDHGEYDLFSYGPDGEEGGEGKGEDIVNWE